MRKLIGMTLVSLMLSSSVALAEAPAAYDKHCKSCHGVDGAGNPDKAKTLKLDPEKLNLGRAESANLTRDEAVKITLEGKSKMPSYQKKLKPEEVDPVVDHAMALAKALREKK
jgi:mono/diheme cytochrome c family protein